MGRSGFVCAPSDAAHVTEVLAADRLFVNELRHDTPTLEAVFFGLTSSDAPVER